MYRRLCKTRLLFWAMVMSFVMILTVFKTNKVKQVKNLSDFQNFHYLIENDICADHEVFMVILVHSSPKHKFLRNVLRNAIKSASLDLKLEFKVVFLLAGVSSKKTTDAIGKENRKHRDIIQGSFVDSYRNLTYKHVMGLKWASDNCQQAKYLMKMDDDIFVDFYKFSHLVRTHFSNITNTDIICNVFTGLKPDRIPGNKWFVTGSEYHASGYPTYCSGWVEVMTPGLASNLATSARDFKPFWIDDIFVTGIIAEPLNLTYHDLDWRVTSDKSSAVDWMVKSPFRNFDFAFIIAPVGRSAKLLKDLHVKARDCHFLGCPSLPLEKWEQLNEA